MGLAVRYAGIQSSLRYIYEYGCHFLVLCSIAEEANNAKIDLIDAIILARTAHVIDEEYTVLDNCKLLRLLTGLNWKQTTVKELPLKIADNEYTEVVYHNKTTGSKHYRRRSVDTIADSRTVREGEILEYRIYKEEI